MDSEWRFLTAAPDIPSAHALVGRLSGEGIRARVVTDTTLLGEGQSCRVFVESTQFHRAHLLLGAEEFSEEELALLAIAPAQPDEPR